MLLWTMSLYFLNAQVWILFPKMIKPVITSYSIYIREAFNIVALCIFKCNFLAILFGQGENIFGENFNKAGQFFV